MSKSPMSRALSWVQPKYPAIPDAKSLAFDVTFVVARWMVRRYCPQLTSTLQSMIINKIISR